MMSMKICENIDYTMIKFIIRIKTKISI
jgi:hypothetical protein